MIKVLVVDDEPLIRKRICLGFDWTSLGYEIPDEAEDGASALEAIRSGDYDVAVVDIAMPGMNGIELTRRLREENSPVQIIFLTGHSDFAYAKEALRYGVYYYILKPVDEDEFKETLRKLRINIENEQRHHQLVSHLSKKQAYADLVLEARYFSDLMLKGMDGRNEEEVREHARNVGLLTDQPFRIITVSGAEFGWKDIELAERYKEAAQAAKEAAGDQRTSMLLNIYDDTFVLLFYGHYTDEEIRTAASAISVKMERISPDSVWIGISKEGSGLHDLRKRYQSSLSAMCNARLYGEKIGIRTGNRDVSRVTAANVKDLQSAVTSGDSSRCKSILSEVFLRIRNERSNYESVLADVNRLMIGLTETGSMIGTDVHLLMEYSSVEAALQSVRSLDELEAWFARLTTDMIESRKARENEKKTIPVIEECCRYLTERSSDAGLTQNEVAEQLGITAAYLSSLFKKTMGISMMNYLRTIRLENARRLLLRHEEVDVRAVAEKVGYSDEFYFSRSFKKYFGVSPSQMRRNQES